MAGDWLKLEHDTPEKPEILAIGMRLNLDPELVFTKCFKVWRWFDRHTVNGNGLGVTENTIDSMVGVIGFAKQLAKVGWLNITRRGATLPNFNLHCGETAKQRALTARRVAKHKAETANDTGVTFALPRTRTRTVRDETRRDDHIDLTSEKESKARAKWEEIAEFCRRKFTPERLPVFATPIPADDFKLLAKLGVLCLQGDISEGDIDDALEAIRLHDGPVRNRGAYLFTVISARLQEQGRDLKRLLAETHVPRGTKQKATDQEQESP